MEILRRKSPNQERDIEICLLISRGMSTAEVAAKTGLSRSRIHQVYIVWTARLYLQQGYSWSESRCLASSRKGEETERLWLKYKEVYQQWSKK